VSAAIVIAAVAVIFYTYVGYPLVLWCAARLRTVRAAKGVGDLPTVTVVISVYNEADRIRRRVENILSSSYPSERLNVLVGSDGSSDGTAEVLRSIQDARVGVSIFDARRGKAAVLNNLLTLVTRDVVVFTDANTHYEPDCVTALARRFLDPEVGGVCGELRLAPDGPSAPPSHEGAYWAYESFIKYQEGIVASTIGATGAVYAVRRSLVRALPTDKVVADDLIQSLHVIAQGRRFVYEPGARALESPATTVTGEMRRRIRIGAGNVTALKAYPGLLSPARGFLAVALWSHKVLRWAVPFLLLLIGIVLVWERWTAGLAATDIWIAAALLLWFVAGWVLERWRIASGVAGWLYYGIMINAGLGWGLLKGLFARTAPTWEKITRSDAPPPPRHGA
jgi:cellulose synthase/poly-beta-1,6-N-acetylglucosamine synthase-like glycosyltransferase